MCDKHSDSGFPAGVMKWYRLKEPGKHLSGGADRTAPKRSLLHGEEREWKGIQGERDWEDLGSKSQKREGYKIGQEK